MCNHPSFHHYQLVILPEQGVLDGLQKHCYDCLPLPLPSTNARRTACRSHPILFGFIA